MKGKSPERPSRNLVPELLPAMATPNDVNAEGNYFEGAEVHEQMSRSVGQSEVRPLVFKSPSPGKDEENGA
ncbi:hypothetical protein TNCV_4538491 [Trichonephila clavipes]|uniref:Uncharacterized protein n=1 Tax=Trichonephila clavipes TaxID=2585209 RepID=A0A8X6WGF1_TRICX|nr:hypothetical protein TNCV_4538491 [Trichonephila clavipes]